MTRCFDNDLYFAICNIFFNQNMFWNVFHQNARSNVFHIENSIKNCLYNDVFFIIFIRFTIFSYWFQDVFIEIFDQKLFHTNDVFFFFAKRKIKIFVSLCQCECDLSKVINFCFIWITHEICDNERIWTSKIVVIVYFISNFWICFCSVIHWSNSRIRALSILLRNKRIDSTKLSMILSSHAYVFEYVFVQSFRWSIEKSMHYSILLFFSHRRSRLMHNRE